MRARSPFALMGVLVILLLSVAGFAAFSAEPPSSSTTEDGTVLPSVASGRVAAVAIASRITSAETERRVAADAERRARQERRVAATSTTTTTPPTTAAPVETEVAETAATAAPTTTTAAPPPTTTSTTTTTAPPPETTTTTAPPPPPPPGGAEGWRDVVEQYWPADLVDGAIAVMDCESGGDPYAYNEGSGASGLYQFLPGTWASASVGAGWDGADVFDGEANIAVAAWLAGTGPDPWSHWGCSP